MKFYQQSLIVTGSGQARFAVGTPNELITPRVAFTSKKFGSFPVGTMILADFEITSNGNRRMISEPVMFAASLLAKEVPKEIKGEGYYIDPEMRLTFTAAKRLGDKGKTVKIMMVGPSGYGKTTIPKLFAQAIGFDFYRMNCAAVRDPEEWFGYREARDGSTVFIKSDLMKRFEKGNVVVVLDEFNRIEPWLHNSLFPLLDDDNATVIHDEPFSLGPNVYVVATINQGFQYTGTFELDEAMMNRFDFVLEVGSLPAAEEKKVLIARTGISASEAQSIVSIANELRSMNLVCSTRSTLIVAEMVSAGMTIREALENGVIRRIVEDASLGNTRKSAVDRINSLIGVLKPRVLTGDVFNSFFNETEKKEETPAPKTTSKKVENRTKFKISGTDSNKIGAIKAMRLNFDISLVEAKKIIDNAIEAGPYVVELYHSTKDEEFTFDFDVFSDLMSSYGFTVTEM